MCQCHRQWAVPTANQCETPTPRTLPLLALLDGKRSRCWHRNRQAVPLGNRWQKSAMRSLLHSALAHTKKLGHRHRGQDPHWKQVQRHPLTPISAHRGHISRRFNRKNSQTCLRSFLPEQHRPVEADALVQVEWVLKDRCVQKFRKADCDGSAPKRRRPSRRSRTKHLRSMSRRRNQRRKCCCIS